MREMATVYAMVSVKPEASASDKLLKGLHELRLGTHPDNYYPVSHPIVRLAMKEYCAQALQTELNFENISDITIEFFDEKGNCLDEVSDSPCVEIDYMQLLDTYAFSTIYYGPRYLTDVFKKIMCPAQWIKLDSGDYACTAWVANIEEKGTLSVASVTLLREPDDEELFEEDIKEDLNTQLKKVCLIDYAISLKSLNACFLA